MLEDSAQVVQGIAGGADRRKTEDEVGAALDLSDSLLRCDPEARLRAGLLRRRRLGSRFDSGCLSLLAESCKDLAGDETPTSSTHGSRSSIWGRAGVFSVDLRLPNAALAMRRT